MSKRIGTPRPPKKDGAMKFQYGSNDGGLDYLILFGPNTERCNRSLVMQLFTSKPMGFDYKSGRPTFGDSFIDELEKRGYDPRTIRFSVDKKAEMEQEK